MRRNPVSQMFLDRMVGFGWVTVVVGVLITILGVVVPSWAVVGFGLVFILVGAGYVWFVGRWGEWMSRRDFEDRWRR
ncbi:hypothetical protein [Actinomadura fibrosa]|uniref:DUF4175 domain-containing protein n=1 Tax=Actinomadura fibrosa TaxID=111802 RepID=A0ABW2Y1H0_9ACTN|nr:hypothetical protein [Actinomadura fibrosa]